MGMKKILFTFFILVAISFVRPAAAATVAELQAQVDALLAQIAAKNATSTVGTSSLPVVGTSVVTTDTVRVRDAYGIYSSLVALQPAGMQGRVQVGPFMANGYRWVQVNFMSGADGWVASDWLRVLPQPATTTPTWVMEDIASVVGYASTTTSEVRYDITLKNKDTYSLTLDKGASSTEQLTIVTNAGFGGDPFELLGVINGDATIESTSTYAFEDIIRVSTFALDYDKMAIDDEATVYRIVLGENDIRTAETFGMMDIGMIERTFAATGYKGDVNSILRWSSDSVKDRITNMVVAGSVVNLGATVSLSPTTLVSVCGPASFGTIDWGDGTNDIVYGLGCSATTQTVAMRHEYKKPGIFLVVLRDQAGNVTSEQITIE
jgi:hypothetical protein